jgi:hypothetical protein
VIASVYTSLSRTKGTQKMAQLISRNRKLVMAEAGALGGECHSVIMKRKFLYQIIKGLTLSKISCSDFILLTEFILPYLSFKMSLRKSAKQRNH